MSRHVRGLLIDLREALLLWRWLRPWLERDTTSPYARALQPLLRDLYEAARAGTREPDPRAVFAGEPEEAARSNELAGWITVATAADRLNVTPQTVRRWCRQRRVAARRIGPVWQVDAHTLPNDEDSS